MTPDPTLELSFSVLLKCSSKKILQLYVEAQARGSRVLDLSSQCRKPIEHAGIETLPK